MIDRIRWESVPQNEVKAAVKYLSDVQMLSNWVQGFQSCLSLFDFSQSQIASHKEQAFREITTNLNGIFVFNQIQHLMGPWVQIAARDGAMQIYHLGRAMDYISSYHYQCPIFKSNVDHDYTKKARKLFREKFPEPNPLRNSVSHLGEFSMQPEAHGTNIPGEVTPDGQPIPVMFVGLLFGRHWTSSVDKKMHSYELSQTTLDDLGMIHQTFLLAFEPLLNRFQAMGPPEALALRASNKLQKKGKIDHQL